jgi:aminoglycoside 6'-N-acetyltransferase
MDHEQNLAVTLEVFDPERDSHLFREWLERPHVARWFGGIRSELEAQVELSPGSTALIMADGVPVGFLCWQRPSWDELEAAALTDLGDDLVDIDILIAEVDALGRGIGPAALGLLLERLRADPAVRYAGVGPSASNERAVRAYGKAGFRVWRAYTDPDRGACLYMLADLHHADRREHRSSSGCDETS